MRRFAAFRGSGEKVLGKYSRLNFETPALGAVLGLDAEVALAHGLSVVPTARYRFMGDPAGTTSYGIGVHWRF